MNIDIKRAGKLNAGEAVASKASEQQLLAAMAPMAYLHPAREMHHGSIWERSKSVGSECLKSVN